MTKLTKCKLILTILPSLFLELVLFANKEYTLYMHLIVGVIFPIISWFVITKSLNIYGKEYEKNRKKINKNTRL